MRTARRVRLGWSDDDGMGLAAELLEPMPSSLLFIDDCDDIRDVLSAALGAAGYEVIACSDGRDALDVTARMNLRPAVVLLDMRMPIMDGWQFLEARRFLAPLASVPVVVLSSEARPPRLPDGVAAWLPKEASLDEIVRTLKRVLEARMRVRRSHRARTWIVGTLAAVAIAVGPGLFLAQALMAKRAPWSHTAMG